jgi:hypothetical protein
MTSGSLTTAQGFHALLFVTGRGVEFHHDTRTAAEPHSPFALLATVRK